MRVGIYADNSSIYINTLISIWNKGDCAVLIDPRIPLEKALEQMKLCGVKVCYTDVEFANNEMTTNLIFKKIEKQTINWFNEKTNIKESFCKFSDREALILFSSGTTGQAKGTILTFGGIQKNAEMIIDYMKPSADDKIFIIKSLAHSSTVVGELLVALFSEIPILLGNTKQHIGSLWNYVINNQITILCLNPSLLHLLSRYLLSVTSNINRNALKRIYTSGSILNVADVCNIKKVLNSVKVFNVYGLTEAGPRVTAQIQETPVGSVGLPIGNVEVIVTDDLGNKLANNQKGLISVKTDSVFKGYVSNESASKKTVYKDWLNTGDIGYFDEQGNLFITGRADRMVTCSGHNVYPEQIEDMISKLEYITDCYVYGVSDLTLGNKLICIYESSENRDKELLYYCNTQLAQYEIPKKFVHGKINKTANGKKTHIV